MICHLLLYWQAVTLWIHPTLSAKEAFFKLVVLAGSVSLFCLSSPPLLRSFRFLRSPYKFTPDLRGCPQGKTSYARHFKENHGKLYIVGKVNKYRFRKKNMNSRKRKSHTTAKMTVCHSVELTGYQIQAQWQNNCTVLITKDQSSKVCEHFSILWLVIF